MRKKIINIEQLKKLASEYGGVDCYIQLNYGARSSKHISYAADDALFHITNEIDDSHQVLTTDQILDNEYTNIGQAMKLGALILYPNKEMDKLYTHYFGDAAVLSALYSKSPKDEDKSK